MASYLIVHAGFSGRLMSRLILLESNFEIGLGLAAAAGGDAPYN